MAAAAAAAGKLAATVCGVCGSGEDEPGNDILLCDGPGCETALHMQCLAKPLYAVPSGDWLCPSCAPAVPVYEPMCSPYSKEHSLKQEQQIIDGTDLGAWAREQSELAPEGSAHPGQWGVPIWLSPDEAVGRACLVALSAQDAQKGREAKLRVGVVLDSRRAGSRGGIKRSAPARRESSGHTQRDSDDERTSLAGMGVREKFVGSGVYDGVVRR